ncbi:hypothetical protein CUMW_283200, partial [Citrus unshiu]
MVLSVKKRKLKSIAGETVEGFNVFKSSKQLAPAVDKEKEKVEDGPSKAKKELNKQIERDAVFRKKYNIHVSGANVPSPLRTFVELSSRFGCESYLLRNLAEHGYKEPTPIQRQAIPVLLSDRECFACAPTGSGKTLAFLCPMLMKLKSLSDNVSLNDQCASKDGIRAVILCPTRELATQTTRECKKLAKGNKFQIKLMKKELRENAVDDFRAGKTWVLIATDVIARGMDFKGVNCVINYDFPNSGAAYIHRI